MGITGECVLCIYGDKLDFDYISRNLNIYPSRIVHMGEKITSKRVAPRDLWSYKKTISNDSDFCCTLKNLVGELIERKDFLEKEIINNNEVIVNCYIRSDMGQIGFSLDSEAVELLYKLGLKIDVHILSFGMIEKEV